MKVLVFVFIVATGYACGDDDHRRTDTNYDDPASVYVPPDLRHRAPKADLASPNPFIEKIEWMPEGACDAAEISPMLIRIRVRDHDTASASLRFEGSVSGCDPIGRGYGDMINENEVLVMCHHVSNHDGMVIVRDLEGHADSVLFTFGPCETGFTDYHTDEMDLESPLP